MSEVTKKCVLVGPGHNLPAEFNPENAEPSGKANIRLLQNGVLELGHCDCDKSRRLIPESIWNWRRGGDRCPHLLVSHSVELLEALSVWKIKTVLVKNMDYNDGVLIWVEELFSHFWLRRLPKIEIIYDSYNHFFDVCTPPALLRLTPLKLSERPKRPKLNSLANWLRFYLYKNSKAKLRAFGSKLLIFPNRSFFALMNPDSTYEIEANTPCFFMEFETEPEVNPRNCAYFLPGHNVFGMLAIKDASRKPIPVNLKFLEGQAVEVSYEGVSETWYTHDPVGLVLLRNRNMFLAEGTTRIYVEMDRGYRPFHLSKKPIQKCKQRRHILGGN